MTLTLDLPPEIETRLQAAAARHGQDVKTFATAALADVAAAPRINGTARSALTATELDAALDELAAIGAAVPAPAERFTHGRDDIYFDHD